MLALLALTTLAAPPAEWRFVDEAAADGRSVLTFRTVALAAKSPVPVADAPAGAAFGVLPLGPRGAHRPAVVWHPTTNAVWLDADHDGTFAPAERHTLGDQPLAVAVRVPFDKTAVERTVLLRRRGDGLAYAVRGYAAGPIAFGTETYPARLTDGDADGCFDSPAADRVWIDLNRDGSFDPLTEQFPLGKPVVVGGRSYLVRSDPPGRVVTAVERSADTGSLTLDVSRLKGTKLAGLTVDLVSEWGELVTVTAGEKPVTVPVGRYRIDSALLRLVAGDGQEWRYRFGGQGGFPVVVKKGEPAVIDLTAGVKLSAAFGPPRRDGAIPTTPAVTTAAGLFLYNCECFERFSTEYGREVEATADLEAPGSASVFRQQFGFLCGRFCTLPVRVPAKADDLELTFRFPSGPLAGDLRADMPPPTGKKK